MPQKIIIETDLPLDKALLELAYIMKRLRETTINWQEHYGAQNRSVMRTWENQADQWLTTHVKTEK